MLALIETSKKGQPAHETVEREKKETNPASTIRDGLDFTHAHTFFRGRTHKYRTSYIIYNELFVGLKNDLDR